MKFKKYFVFAFAIVAFLNLSAQNKYFTKEASIALDATAKSSPESIVGTSTTGTSVIDAKDGALEFLVLIKSINFHKALMQEHFNENYLESSKFPKANFKGKIENIADINFEKDGNYKAKVSGTLTIHGISKQVSSTATFKVSNGKIEANSKFSVILSDYSISIPSLVADKVAKTANLEINAVYKLLKK